MSKGSPVSLGAVEGIRRAGHVSPAMSEHYRRISAQVKGFAIVAPEVSHDAELTPADDTPQEKGIRVSYKSDGWDYLGFVGSRAEVSKMRASFVAAAAQRRRQCFSCFEIKKSVSMREDPYQAAVNDNDAEVQLCDECAQSSRDDI